VVLPGIEMPAPDVGAIIPVEVIDRLFPDVIVWMAVTVVPVMVFVVCAALGDGLRTPARTIIDAPARSVTRRAACLRAETVGIVVISIVHSAFDRRHQANARRLGQKPMEGSGFCRRRNNHDKIEHTPSAGSLHRGVNLLYINIDFPKSLLSYWQGSITSMQQNVTSQHYGILTILS
jgi:hypothetical protein